MVAQVSLGFYDGEGNLLSEETFPQVDGNPIVAKLFHPHAEQLESLIAVCVDQAWVKLNAEAFPTRPAFERDGAEEACQTPPLPSPPAS